MNHLTVKELRDALENLDDDTIVCGTGHFGETLQIQIEGVHNVTYDGGSITWRENKMVKAFVLQCEDAGPDPD